MVDAGKEGEGTCSIGGMPIMLAKSLWLLSKAPLNVAFTHTEAEAACE